MGLRGRSTHELFENGTTFAGVALLGAGGLHPAAGAGGEYGMLPTSVVLYASRCRDAGACEGHKVLGLLDPGR